MKTQSKTSTAFKRRDHPAQMCFDFAPAVSAPVPLKPREILVDKIPVLAAPPPVLIPTPALESEALPPEIERLAEDAREEKLAADGAYLTDSRAAELIELAAQTLRPGDVHGVRVRFLPFRATLYSFKLDKRRTANVKFHLAFRRASDAVVLQAAQLMLCRSRKIRTTLPRAEYDHFVRSMTHGDFKMPGARKASKRAHGAEGIHRHLVESFQRINATYFKSQLKQPELCWSPARAKRILGSYQERSDRLIISRVFDSPNVPLFVLDFLMYHELLHKFLGIGRRGDGRRCIHSAEFKRLEKQYARYAEAEAFIKRL